MLFDGAAVATGLEVTEAVEVGDAQPRVQGDAREVGESGGWWSGSGDSGAALGGAVQLLVVDASVGDWQTLVSGVGPDVRVVLLDADRDGVQQLAQAVLSVQGPVSAVHVLSHGESGALRLGDRTLDGEQLARYEAELAAIGGRLEAGGDILLYGCEVGSGEQGAAFLSALARATKADVAASTDMTGARGDWDLEAATGTIEAAVAISAQAQKNWDGTLNVAPLPLPDRASLPVDGERVDGNVVTGEGPGDQADIEPDPGDSILVVGVRAGVVDGVFSGQVGSTVAGRYGTLAVSADGTYVYRLTDADPAVAAIGPGEFLEDRFSYTIADRNGGCTSTTLTVRIDGVDRPPDGTDRVLAISEDLVDEAGEPLRLAPSDFGFRDPDAGDFLSAVRIDTLPSSGQLSFDDRPVEAGETFALEAIGRLSYRPAADANRDNLPQVPQIGFSVRDSRGVFDPLPNTLTIDIRPVNDPPSATGARYVVERDATPGSAQLRTPAPAPTDPDQPAQPLEVTIDSLPDPARGAFQVDGAPAAVGQTVAADRLQTLAYVPNPAIAGTPNADGTLPGGALAFTVRDGEGGAASAAVVVDVRVAPPPRVPQEAPAPPTFTVPFVPEASRVAAKPYAPTILLSPEPRQEFAAIVRDAAEIGAIPALGPIPDAPRPTAVKGVVVEDDCVPARPVKPAVSRDGDKPLAEKRVRPPASVSDRAREAGGHFRAPAQVRPARAGDRTC